MLRPQFILTSIPLLAQCPCGIDDVRRPWLLRRLVEFHVLGPIRSRLESPSSQLPSSACLSFFHLRFSTFTLVGHRHHFLAKRLCTRARHVVHIQETERVLDGSAVASVTLDGSKPEIHERAGLIGEYNLLGGAFHRVSLVVCHDIPHDLVAANRVHTAL